MKVLITGAGGFLGRNVQKHFESGGDEVFSLNRNSGDYQTDLSSEVPSLNRHFDMVVHCAGKAHSIPRTPEQNQEFYRANVRGTENLLKALEKDPPECFVFISTVAVYGRESGEEIGESFPINGNTPYARSKAEAESILREWGKKNSIPVLILRPPLIAGPNSPGNLGKMVSGIRNGRYLSINGGKARRSVVMAEDISRCIKNNAGKSGTYNITDGYHPTFREIEMIICRQLGKSLPLSLPGWLAGIIGKAGDIFPSFPVNSDTIGKMSSHLTFDDSRARKELDWNPQKVTESFKIF